ncbi:MAG: hypothetical protein JRD89_12315 [Deltaproteobacteria bacterium]|nr:hypothetical protein [Deltaproteobacteria bacterium]
MIDLAKTRAFFQKRFVDNVGTIGVPEAQVVWENVTDDGVDKTATWVRFSWTSIGNEFRTFGEGGMIEFTDMGTIEIFLPITGKTQGTKTALDIQKQLLELYKIGTQGKADTDIAVYVDTTRPLTLGQFDSAYHREAMQFVYRAWTPN